MEACEFTFNFMKGKLIILGSLFFRYHTVHRFVNLIEIEKYRKELCKKSKISSSNKILKKKNSKNSSENNK